MVYDLVIQNGRLMDPGRNLDTRGNVAVSDGKIKRITRETIHGRTTIDARGSVVCPGFIDIHAHVDGNLYPAQCMVRQGVTTTVGGNCGLSPLEIGRFLDSVEVNELPLNSATFIGHSFSMREAAGATDRYQPATQEQIEAMKDMLHQGLEEGAVGLSLGLEYSPGASLDEVLELARVCAVYGKPVAIHTRYDAWRGVEGFAEAVRICEETGAPVQISHVVYMVGMGQMNAALSVLDDARNRHLDLTADSGVYSAFATFLGSAVFDDWPGKYGCRYEDMVAATGPHSGQRFTEEVFKRWRRETPDMAVIAFVGRESEIGEALTRPYMMVSTDGAVGNPSPGTGHPQDAGTFPRLLGTHVRETGLLSLMDALRKITIMPAERLGLRHKGRLAVGCDADIVVFDPKTVRDKAEYPVSGKPDAPPEGISHVVVNGEPVVVDGYLLEGRGPGRSVRVKNEVWEG